MRIIWLFHNSSNLVLQLIPAVENDWLRAIIVRGSVHHGDFHKTVGDIVAVEPTMAKAMYSRVEFQKEEKNGKV